MSLKAGRLLDEVSVTIYRNAQYDPAVEEALEDRIQRRVAKPTEDDYKAFNITHRPEWADGPAICDLTLRRQTRDDMKRFAAVIDREHQIVWRDKKNPQWIQKPLKSAEAVKLNDEMFDSLLTGWSDVIDDEGVPVECTLEGKLWAEQFETHLRPFVTHFTGDNANYRPGPDQGKDAPASTAG